MHRILCVCCLLVTLSSCRPTSDAVGAANDSAGIAETHVKVPITSQSREARALYLQGRTLTENLQAHDGQALFERAVAKDPGFAMAEYSLALTAPSAKAVFEHVRKAVALANSASDGERLMILALQTRTNADPAKVRQLAETLVTRYPKDERAHWILGNAYFAEQLYDRSINEYQKAIEINPSYSLAYNSVGYADRAMGNTVAAEKAFQKYIALVPHNPNPYDSYAELLMKTGRFDASIAQYQKALSINPHFGGSYVGIAADYMFAGQYDAAIAEARAYYDAARDDAERRNALFSPTLTYVDAGATDKALQSMNREYDLARAIGDTANMSADAVAAGDILLDAGRVGAARSRYKQAHDIVAASSLSTEIKQDNALATRYNMARVALENRDLTTAHTEAAVYQNLAKAGHNDFRVRQAHELNGLVALADRKFDSCLAELALADQQNPAVLYAMARGYRGKGDTAKANELMTQAVNSYTLPTLPYVFIRARAKHAT